MTLFYVMAIMAWVYTYDMVSVHNLEPERSRVTIVCNKFGDRYSVPVMLLFGSHAKQVRNIQQCRSAKEAIKSVT